MTSDERRSDYLAALGLVDWQYRDDGPLVQTTAAVRTPADDRVDAETPAVPEPTGAAPDRADDSGGSPAPETPEGESSAPIRPAPDPESVLEPAVEKASEPPVEVDHPGDPPLMGSGGETEPAAEPRDDGPAGLDWAGLEAYLARQDHRGAARPVFGVGARDAEVLIVGEAPGANEDAQGVPFVGRAGKLLDRMLFAIGCSRDTNVYITNICKFRPPDNRDPRPEEVAADWPILERQIDLMNPKLVVAVGRVAAQTLLDCQTPLGKMRGQLHRYPRRELDVLVTYHPAYLLRSPDQKRKAWGDLKRIARHIGGWRA